MTKTDVGVILSELGWEDGFRIPVANEENRRLEEEIESKRKHKASLSAKLESLEERKKMARKYTGSIADQQAMNQKLLTAHSAQLESERHLYRLCDNTEMNLRQETRDLEKMRNDIDSRISVVEKDLAKTRKRVETLKRTIKFDEKCLLEWEEVLDRKEENKQLIEQFLKQDAKKYKELEQQREKLSVELENYRHMIVKVIDDGHELECALTRTAKFYVEALQERRQMMEQWTQSVAVLRQRDSDIQRSLREIEILRDLGREKTSSLREAENFLDDQVANNKQLEDVIKKSDKKLAMAKEEHQKIVEAIDMYTIEIQAQRKNMTDLTRRSSQLVVDIKRKRIEIDNKLTKTEDVRKRISELSASLDEICNQGLNAEGRTKQLEAMIEQEDKRKQLIGKELNRLQGSILRSAGRIKNLEKEKKILEMQRQNECKKNELLNALSKKEMGHLEEKKEAIYHVEFSVQKCEMKLERIRGRDRDKLESERRQRTIEELQSTYAEKTETSKLLKSQIASLDRDMKKISGSVANDNRELERLRNKKQDLLLLMDGGEKRVKVAQSQNEERQVEENILRLKVSQVERVISHVGGKVYNLEKYRLQLEAALRERRVEIGMLNESIVVQKRIIAKEYSDLRCAIAERRNRIEQLQARYENVSATFGTDPDGMPLSTTYLKIQNAQEKYLLQEQGDKLDEAIRKAEQEIQSMENTLRIVNACNDKYKDSLGTVDEHAPEQAKRRKLDEDLRNARLLLKRTEAALENTMSNLEKVEEAHENLLKEIEKANEDKENKERLLTNLKRQIDEQREKISRAEKSLRKTHKNLENTYATAACGADESTMIVRLQMKDVLLRQLREQNQLVLEDIAELAIRHVEAESYIKKQLAVKKIELPCGSVLSYRQSPMSSQCDGNTASSKTESDLKYSTSRVSGEFPSSRESISSIVTIEPCFRKDSVKSPTASVHSKKESVASRSKTHSSTSSTK